MAAIGLLIVMFMYVLLWEPLPVYAASSLIQQNSNGCLCTSNPAVVTVSFLSNVAKGHVILVGLAFSNKLHTTGLTPTILDTRGSTFTKAITKTDTQKDVAAIYTAHLSSSGPDTVTVQFTNTKSPSFNVYWVFIYEVAGVTTIGKLTATGTGPSGSFSTSTSVSFPAGSFLLGVIYYSSTGSTCKVGAGFTLSPGDSTCGTSGGDYMAEYSTAGVSSPTKFRASSTGTDPWAEAGIALKP